MHIHHTDRLLMLRASGVLLRCILVFAEELEETA